MSNRCEARLEAEGLKLSDLIDALEESGMVWGRNFVVKGNPEPDVFQLLFENELLAVRARVLWRSKLRSSDLPAAE